MFKLPAGHYYIGDISNILLDSIYTKIWGNQHVFSNGKFDANGFSFAVSQTAYDYGGFHGSNDQTYPVDAGNIGIVPEGLFDPAKVTSSPTFGTFHDFMDEITFEEIDGHFHVASPLDQFDLTIETGEYDEEENVENEE